ncbi:hypothetical protein TVAG_326500 [Trichomonas vaginalis G3]|uniref:Uncharacterized protein n=1 Tax=Trichomonas vaginalis (strain ATCC PRA-98 / G3) TaxID=412133 RepID=A2FT65_TRIV3|nr:hypothetical protein TVAGG3_0431070 [Trichomonas vaginalis G3]EAX91906.1 hypothetical protein TVAG_326500 [Trichomonas vaginalis G3]KAI5536756.1 hypothetical protein TVAGG3_0431070 [Trichomonas vaginalis G3]|eukprot:XP_001304836.1 hypothetical protein [Trichomonas vaginalis G3]
MLNSVNIDENAIDQELRRYHSEDNLFHNIIERQYMTNEIKQMFFKSRQQAITRKSCAHIVIPDKTVLELRNKKQNRVSKDFTTNKSPAKPPSKALIKKPKLIKVNF